MGTVRKQSIYSFIFILIGFALGAANTLLLYAKFLTTEEYGLTGIFRDVSVLFSTIATFGSGVALYKFFPLYQARLGREKNDLPFIILTVGLFGSLCFFGAAILFKDLIIRKFAERSPLFVEYFYLVVPLTISVIIMIQLEGLAYMLKRSATSNFIKEIGFRLVQTIAILLYRYDYINISTFFVIFSLMYVPTVIALIILVTRNNGIKLNFYISGLTRKIYRKVISFSLFHFSGLIISVLPVALNGILIAGISDRGLHDVAIYTIASFMITILEVPLRGMRGIGIATYSEAFLHKDLDKVERMQKNASLSLLIVGFCLFGLIYPNIENIVYFSKGKDFHPVINIFLIAGSAKLIELSMGMNDSLLALSKYWRTDFIISSIIVLLSIPVNILLIRKDPLLGAAAGQAIILFLFCIVRSITIWTYFKIQPYTSKTLIVFMIGIIATLVSYQLPDMSSVYIDVLVKGIVFIILFAGPILYFNVSKEMNELFLITKKRLLRR